MTEHRLTLKVRILFFALFPFLFLPLLTAEDAEQENAASAPARQGIRVVRKTICPRETTLYEFSNGLTLFVQRNDTGLATVRSYVKNTGSANEKEWLGTGISHLTEHIVCGGSTTKRGREETRIILERLGGKFNAFTGKELTGYYIDCSSEQLMPAVDLITDWMTRCAVDEDELQREKRVITQELTDAENEPENAAMELLMKTVYRENPYRHPVGGYLDLFAKLTRDDVKRFYETRYTPNNTIYYVAGRVKEEEVVARFLDIYKEIPRGIEAEPEPQTEPRQIAPREAVREMDGEMFRLMLAWPTVTLDHEDAYALDVLAVLLSGGASGRLDRKIQDGKKIGSSFSASSMTPSSVPGLFLIRSKMRPSEVESVQAAILDEIRQLSETAVTTEELDRAKKLTETSFVFGRETLSASADSCVFNYVITGDPNFDDRYLEGIRKVSPADISRVVRTYFNSNSRNRVLITPFEMAPVAVPQNQDVPDTAMDGFHTDNGLTILVKRVSALPMVTVQVYALGSALIDDEATAGRTSLLAAMLDKGSQNYTKTEVENYFDSIGGSLEFYAGRNTLACEMTVLKDDYKQAMGIMADLLLHPAFPEEEFQKAKKLQIDKINLRQDSPVGKLFTLFSDALPATTPYHIQLDGTPDTLKKLRLDDLRLLHRQMITPDRMVAAVVGDIDPSEAVSAVKSLLGELQKPSNSPSISFDRNNEFVELPDEHKTANIGTGLGIIAWPTVKISDEKEYAAITVLQAVLGGYGTPGGRLFEELRAEGLVYWLKVDQMTGPVPGYFYAAFQTAPDQINEIFDRIEKGVERIKGGDLPEDELTRVKERITAFHLLEMETIGSQAHQAALDDLYGFGYWYDADFAKRIDAVTRDDVIAAAQKYFSQPAKVSVSGNEKR